MIEVVPGRIYFCDGDDGDNPPAKHGPDPPLDDATVYPLPAAVQREKDAGMQLADDNADTRWKRMVDAAILAVARRQPEFTVDDVLDELDKIPDCFTTHNLRALGPRMKEVSRVMRYMEPTASLVRSRRPLKHGNYHKVWRSLKHGS